MKYIGCIDGFGVFQNGRKIIVKWDDITLGSALWIPGTMMKTAIDIAIEKANERWDERMSAAVS